MVCYDSPEMNFAIAEKSTKIIHCSMLSYIPSVLVTVKLMSIRYCIIAILMDVLLLGFPIDRLKEKLIVH